MRAFQDAERTNKGGMEPDVTSFQSNAWWSLGLKLQTGPSAPTCSSRRWYVRCQQGRAAALTQTPWSEDVAFETQLDLSASVSPSVKGCVVNPSIMLSGGG